MCTEFEVTRVTKANPRVKRICFCQIMSSTDANASDEYADMIKTMIFGCTTAVIPFTLYLLLQMIPTLPSCVRFYAQQGYFNSTKPKEQTSTCTSLTGVF